MSRLLLLLCPIILPLAARGQPLCPPPQPAEAGWTVSFIASCTDAGGHFAGGSQIIHLVAHKGQLYAANGYWMDEHNPVYGQGRGPGPWSQVLRLSGPNEPWRVDLELGPHHMRTELLKSVTFTRDGQGRPLPAPDTKLLAATYDGAGRSVDVFVRDDTSGSWAKTQVLSGPTGHGGEDNSVRAAAIHVDRITGQERLLISVGIVGIFAGRYDPAATGKIVWDTAPEFAGATTRVLGMAEANGSLFVSEGTRVYRRVDGPAPRYELVADLTGEADPNTDRAALQTIGGIRGLTAVTGPVPGKQSLMFLWLSGKNSKDCVNRLDPAADGGVTRVQEICLAGLIGRHLGGAPIPYAQGAYSSILALRDPVTGAPYHLLGLGAFIPATPAGQPFLSLVAPNQHTEHGGFYGGGLYALRDAQGQWRLGDVNGVYRPGKRDLVSVYTYALSPFGGADAGNIYLGGYDPNYHLSTDRAWIFRTSVATLLAAQ